MCAMTAVVCASAASAQIEGRAWLQTSPYPFAAYQLDPVEYNGFIYSAGGWNGTPGGVTTAVCYAPIELNGSVGAWTTSPHPLPQPDQGPGLAAANGFLYVIGYDSVVLRLAINPDDSVGPPQNLGTVGNLPPGNGRGGRMQVEAYAGHLYVVGGWTGNNFYPDIWVAPLLPNGNLGDWTQTTSMPEPRQHQSVHFINRRLYIIGGITSGLSILSSVRSAPVNCDGTIGTGSPGTTWRDEESLPNTLWYHSSIVIGQDILVIGGVQDYSSATVSTKVYRASVNAADGTLSPWAEAGTVPLSHSSGPGAVYSPRYQRTYLIGGYNPVQGTFTNVVLRDVFCYADCDVSGALTANDFLCFLNKFAQGCLGR
jgi:hypothetical protein